MRNIDNHARRRPSCCAACGQSSDDDAANQAAAKPRGEEEGRHIASSRSAETKGWAATRDKDGNVVVKGKAYRQDPRYKAVLGPPVVTGASAEDCRRRSRINDTGYAAPENWWDVSATIPNSAAGSTGYRQLRGARALAKLEVPPPKS